MLSDNGQALVSKFFTALCAYLRTAKLKTTAFRRQTNGQMEIYNGTDVSRLRIYIVDSQKKWEVFAQPLTYAYICQVHLFTAKTPISLVILRYRPGPTVIETPTVLPTDTYSEPNRVILRQRVLAQQANLGAKLSVTLAQQHVCYKRY